MGGESIREMTFDKVVRELFRRSRMMKRVLTALTVILLSAIAACRPSPVYTPTPPLSFTPTLTFTPVATQLPPTATEPTKQITATPVNEALQYIERNDPNLVSLLEPLWRDGLLDSQEKALVDTVSRYDTDIQPDLVRLVLADGIFSDIELNALRSLEESPGMIEYAVKNSYPPDIFDPEYIDRLTNIYKENRKGAEALISALALFPDDPETRKKLADITLDNGIITGLELEGLKNLSNYSHEQQVEMINDGYLIPLTNHIVLDGYGIPLRGLQEYTDPDVVIKLARQANANCIQITNWMLVDPAGNIMPPDPANTYENIVSRIKKYHSADFQVWLVNRTILSPMMPGEKPHELVFELNPELFCGLSKAATDRFLSQLEPMILESARIAQEEHVEIFTPVAAGQLYLLLKSNTAFSWSNSLLPRVRDLYDGIVVQKIDLNPCTQQLPSFNLSPYDFKGWDYVTTDVFGSNYISGHCQPVRTYEEWRSFIQQLLETAIALHEKYETQGIILGPEIMLPESDASTLKAGTEFWGHGDFTLEEMERSKVRLWNELFQETLGVVDGYCFWNWAPGDQIALLGVEKEHNGVKYQSRDPVGYQGRGPMELIAKYYELDQSSVEMRGEKKMEELNAEYYKDALSYIQDIEMRLNQQKFEGSDRYISYLENVRKMLREAKKILEKGRRELEEAIKTWIKKKTSILERPIIKF